MGLNKFLLMGGVRAVSLTRIIIFLHDEFLTSISYTVKFSVLRTILLYELSLKTFHRRKQRVLLYKYNKKAL